MAVYNSTTAMTRGEASYREVLVFSSLYQLTRATSLGLCIQNITQPLVRAEAVLIPERQSLNQAPVYLDYDFLTKITLWQ